MAISIPAILDTQLTTLRNELLPKQDGATNIASSALPPYVKANRVADIIRQLTGLIDAGPLAATGGTDTTLLDAGAFTGTDVLIGSIVTLEGNVTAALAGYTARVKTHDGTTLTFDSFWTPTGVSAAKLPAAVQAGDNYIIEFSMVDKDLAALEQAKGPGDSASNPYGPGPSLMNIGIILLFQLSGAIPSYLDAATANPFGLGSPHAGGNGQLGHGGAALIADMLLLIRNAVAAYTVPA